MQKLLKHFGALTVLLVFFKLFEEVNLNPVPSTRCTILGICETNPDDTGMYLIRIPRQVQKDMSPAEGSAPVLENTSTGITEVASLDDVPKISDDENTESPPEKLSIGALTDQISSKEVTEISAMESDSSIQEIETTTGETSAIAQESGASTDENSSTTRKSEAPSEERETSTQENETTTQESEATSQDSGTTTQESEALTVSQEGEASTQDSEAGTQENETSTQDIGTTTLESETVTKESGAPSQESEPTTQESEVPTLSQDGETTKQEAEPLTVQSTTITPESEATSQGSGTTTQGSEAPTLLQEGEAAGTQGSETNVQENETSTKENETSALENETSTQENETSAKENETSAKENETSAKENETSTQENETSTQDIEITTQESETPIHGVSSKEPGQMPAWNASTVASIEEVSHETQAIWSTVEPVLDLDMSTEYTSVSTDLYVEVSSNAPAPGEVSNVPVEVSPASNLQGPAKEEEDEFDELVSEMATAYVNESRDDLFPDSRTDASFTDLVLPGDVPYNRPLVSIDESLFDSMMEIGTIQPEGTDEYEQQLIKQGTSPGCVFEDREKFKRSMLTTVYSKMDGNPTMLIFLKDENCVGTLSKSGHETVRSRGILLPQLPLSLQVEAGMFMQNKIYLFDSSSDQKVWGFKYNQTTKMYHSKAHAVVSTDYFLQLCGIKAHGIRVTAVAQFSLKDPTCIIYDESGRPYLSEHPSREALSLVASIQYLQDAEYIDRIQSIFSWLDEPVTSVFVYGSNGELFQLFSRNSTSDSSDAWPVGHYKRVPYEYSPLNNPSEELAKED